jgi:hypothetical protein
VRSHRFASGSWTEHVRGTTTSENSHLAKVRLLKLLLAMKFNLHMLFFCARLKLSLPLDFLHLLSYGIYNPLAHCIMN